MNVTLTVDRASSDAMQKLPKNISASKLLRHLMKAGSYDEHQWAEYKKTEDCKVALEYLKTIKTRLGK